MYFCYYGDLISVVHPDGRSLAHEIPWMVRPEPVSIIDSLKTGDQSCNNRARAPFPSIDEPEFPHSITRIDYSRLELRQGRHLGGKVVIAFHIKDINEARRIRYENCESFSYFQEVNMYVHAEQAILWSILFYWTEHNIIGIVHDNVYTSLSLITF